MSMGEIIIILIVAVLVLGPEKLPSTLVQVAKVLKALKRQVDEARESIEKEVRLSEIKKEADKYKNEFSDYNENIRKKLSFEEFDELKNSVNKGVEGIKDSLKFGNLGANSGENSANFSGNLAENSAENLAGDLNSVAGVENSAENAGAAGAGGNSAENLAGVSKAENAGVVGAGGNSALGENSAGNLAETSANSAGAAEFSENSAENSANAANSINENADFSTPNGKISRAKAQMLGLDILENSSEYGASFGSGEKSSAQTTSQCCEQSVNSIADDSEIIAKNSKTKATNSQISTPKIQKTATAKTAKKSITKAKNSTTTQTNSSKPAKNSANSAQNSRPKTTQVKTKKSPKAEKSNV